LPPQEAPLRTLAIGFAVYVAVVIAASALGVYVLLPLTANLRTNAAAPAVRSTVIAQDLVPPVRDPADTPPATIDPLSAVGDQSTATPVIATATVVPSEAGTEPAGGAPEAREPETEWSPATKLGMAMALLLADQAAEADAPPTRLALVPPAPVSTAPPARVTPVDRPPVDTVPVAAAPVGDVAILLQRGEALLTTGDVAAARLFFGRAAERGDAAGAIGLAKTYDPLFLAQAGFRTTRGDAAQAAAWYRRALAAGHADAAARLDRLLAAAQPKS
jgi:hypothetical protein